MIIDKKKNYSFKNKCLHILKFYLNFIERLKKEWYYEKNNLLTKNIISNLIVLYKYNFVNFKKGVIMGLFELNTPIKNIKVLKRINSLNKEFKCNFLDIKGVYQLGTMFSPLQPPNLSPEAIVLLDNLGFDLSTISGIKNVSKNYPEVSNQKSILYGGKYLTGHPEINEPTDKILFFIDGSNLNITTFKNDSFQIIGKININTIIDISLEDKSTLESRVTATRLLTLGIFAFALKKNEKFDLAYVTIKMKNNNFNDEMILEFSGKNSMTLANTFKNSIRKLIIV